MSALVEPVTCIQTVRREGMDRLCGQTVGLVRWQDHTGHDRAACVRHQGGLRRRYPASVPERTAPAGTLGLPSPWARGAFAPDDVIRVENAIPEGYRIYVVPQNPHRFVVKGLRISGDPSQHDDELFVSATTSDPVRVALGMCERLALHEAGAA